MNVRFHAQINASRDPSSLLSSSHTHQTLSQSDWSLQQQNNVSVFKLVRKFNWLGSNKHHKGSKQCEHKAWSLPHSAAIIKATKTSLLSAGLENWNTDISTHQQQPSDGDWCARPAAEKGEKDRKKEQKEQANLFWAVRLYYLIQPYHENWNKQFTVC